MTAKFVDSVIMLKGKKKEFYGVKKTNKSWDVYLDNLVISKLIYKYLIGYLDEVIKFKGKNNKLMFLQMDDEKLLEKY